MKTTLQSLIALQAIDTIILDLQRTIDAFPALIERLDQQLNEHENTLVLARSRVEEQEKLRRAKELEIETRNDQIKKYQGQLLQVKTNKEYSALLAEINGLKTKNSLTEDDILELMESIERAKKTIIETQKEVEQEKVKIAQVKQEKAVEQAAIQEKLAQQQAQRQQLAVTVKENVLKEYARLLNLRNGIAVAEVDDNGVCSGCHVALTPQMFAEAKTGDYLHRCPTCFRFIYWPNSALEEQLTGETQTNKA